MQAWDIFCRVVDNYGDAGVAWRLARQLAGEHALQVRLWIDEPAALARMCPQLDAALGRQTEAGVQVWHWDAQVESALPAEVVIEAFGCELPPAYVARMAQQARRPVWINLEYLSAEAWVDEYHALASPHPQLPLTKYFFFPGVTARTGGLLREYDLLAERDAFERDGTAQDRFWQGLGVPGRIAGEIRVSLFAYENPEVAHLLEAWSQGAVPVRCLVPDGRVLPEVGGFFAAPSARAGDVFTRGQLTVHVLPFTDQPGYDRLLWACDWNFVRGEDSFVRAQWAARPFVWQIYPQSEAAHHDKLLAFWRRYQDGLEPAAAAALEECWRGWNGLSRPDWQALWAQLAPLGAALNRHAARWAREQAARPDLSAQLVEFAAKVAN